MRLRTYNNDYCYVAYWEANFGSNGEGSGGILQGLIVDLSEPLWRVYGANTARARTLVFELALLHFTADNVPICGAQRA